VGYYYYYYYYFFFFFFGARCESAEAAAVFEALLVRLSRITFEAALPAFADVFRCLAISGSLRHPGFSHDGRRSAYTQTREEAPRERYALASYYSVSA